MEPLLDAADLVSLGLDKVGGACSVNWTDADIAKFEQGLNECKRDFVRIATNFLSHKGPRQVGDFYYNLWKPKAISQAKEWYHRRDEVMKCPVLMVF